MVSAQPGVQLPYATTVMGLVKRNNNQGVSSGSRTRPIRSAWRTACVLSLTRNLEKILLIRFFTVFSLRTNLAAISLLLSPSAASPRTSSSLGVSAS